MQATLSNLRKDMLIRYEGECYRILEFEHVSRFPQSDWARPDDC